MDLIIGYFGNQVVSWAAGGVLAVIIAWILRRVPNDRIKEAVGKFFYGLGVVVTLGLSKWKYTAGLWNKTIEPWVIDLIDNVVSEGVQQFILGLRSDNSSE